MPVRAKMLGNYSFSLKGAPGALRRRAVKANFGIGTLVKRI